jgi:hypothetical protein
MGHATQGIERPMILLTLLKVAHMSSNTPSRHSKFRESKEALAKSALGISMLRVLARAGLEDSAAHKVLLEATDVVDEFLDALSVPPSPGDLAHRVATVWAGPQRQLETALASILPALAIIRR